MPAKDFPVLENVEIETKKLKLSLGNMIRNDLSRHLEEQLLRFEHICGDRLAGRIILTLTKMMPLGGSPGLVVMGDDSCSKCCGFEYQHHFLDGHFFTLICCKIVLFVW